MIFHANMTRGPRKGARSARIRIHGGPRFSQICLFVRQLGKDDRRIHEHTQTQQIRHLYIRLWCTHWFAVSDMFWPQIRGKTH
jgi:hypothetical protein